MGKNKQPKLAKKPFVSICTPTFNRRPFIPIIIKCIENQTYPKDKFEWIIVDDGSDKIEDLVTHLPYVKYHRYEEKMTIGKKRNLTNKLATGDVIVYMDDDDYYPPSRIQHAVDMLRSSKALCAGSSEMYLYFKHITKMYKFGPYGPKHATAATFAFKKELLDITSFSEVSSLAEEKTFLKDYTIPFIQLDPKKTILVFSHDHNSFDKKNLLKQLPNPHVHETDVVPSDLVNEPEVLKFFMEDINEILDNYDIGNPKNKPDVTKQLSEMTKERETQAQEMRRKQIEYNEGLQKITAVANLQNQVSQQNNVIQQLTTENKKLQEQVVYLNNKIKELISSFQTK